jgi:outer membrane protein TolC
VPELLADLEGDLIRSMAVPARAGARDDVRAVEQGARASAAGARLSADRSSPTLEAYARLGRNGQDAQLAPAMSDAFDKHPVTTFGLRFATPLELWNVFKSKRGWSLEESAADDQYQRKVFESDRDWADLSEKIREAKSRLELSRAIENAQKKKLTRERERLNIGRSTTYQVLLFEQDFAQAQLSRIQAQADVLNIIAQMKLFSGGGNS